MKNKTQNKKVILFIGNHLTGVHNNLSINEELSQFLELQGWTCILSSRRMNRTLRLLDMLFTIVHRRKDYSIVEIDIFSGNAFTWGFLCALLVKILQKPLILELHGGNLPLFSEKHPKAVKRLLGWGNIVISPSPYLQQYFSPIRSDIKIIANGIDLKKYAFRLRTEIKPKLVWLRAFHEIYNPSLAPKVIAELQKLGIKSQLIMVGPDKADGSLQKTLGITQKLEVEDSLTIIAGVPKKQVPFYLNEADIFLNTTNVDNLPVSIIEAMACGLCIVSTNVGGIPHLVKDHITGLLSQPEDASAMALLIQSLIMDSSLAQQISKNARLNAEKYDWSVVTSMWISVFNELL